MPARMLSKLESVIYHPGIKLKLFELLTFLPLCSVGPSPYASNTSIFQNTWRNARSPGEKYRYDIFECLAWIAWPETLVWITRSLMDLYVITSVLPTPLRHTQALLQQNWLRVSHSCFYLGKEKKKERKREITILGINFQILSWRCYGTFSYPSVLVCVYNQHLLSGISSSLKNISGNAVPLWPLINLSIVTCYNRKMIENAYSFTSLFFSQWVIDWLYFVFLRVEWN